MAGRARYVGQHCDLLGTDAKIQGGVGADRDRRSYRQEVACVNRKHPPGSPRLDSGGGGALAGPGVERGPGRIVIAALHDPTVWIARGRKIIGRRPIVTGKVLGSAEIIRHKPREGGGHVRLGGRVVIEQPG